MHFIPLDLNQEIALSISICHKIMTRVAGNLKQVPSGNEANIGVDYLSSTRARKRYDDLPK